MSSSSPEVSVFVPNASDGPSGPIFNFSTDLPDLNLFFDDSPTSTAPENLSSSSSPPSKTVPDPSDALEFLASRLSALTQRIEQALYAIGEEEEDCPNIVTLPYNCGGDQEQVSVIQPVAWQHAGPGSFYDPHRKHVMRNCLGYWNGDSGSLRGHLARLVTQPCFLGYHAFVGLAIVYSIVMSLLPRNAIIESHPLLRTWPCVLIPLIAFLYDALAMVFVVLMDVYLPEGGDPRLASAVQARIEAAVRAVLLRVGNGDAQRVAERIVGEFYPKAWQAVQGGVKFYSQPKNAGAVSWRTMEAFLIVLRFVRGVSDARGVVGDAKIQELTSEDLANAQRAIQQGVTLGNEEVHLQLLRIIYKGFQPAKERQDRILENREDLAINHFLGTQAQVQELGKRLKLAKGLSPQRAANLQLATSSLPREQG